MSTLSITKNGYTFRWRGGTFIAAWRSVNAGSKVPDSMIEIPQSYNRSRVTNNDLRRIINEHMGWTE